MLSDEYSSSTTTSPFSLVTRVEVIDETGRAYVRTGVEVESSFQDEGRTLKLFVKKPQTVV